MESAAQPSIWDCLRPSITPSYFLIHGQEFDGTLTAGLRHVTRGPESGPMGWNQSVLDLFQVAEPENQKEGT